MYKPRKVEFAWVDGTKSIVDTRAGAFGFFPGDRVIHCCNGEGMVVGITELPPSKAKVLAIVNIADIDKITYSRYYGLSQEETWKQRYVLVNRHGEKLIKAGKMKQFKI